MRTIAIVLWLAYWDSCTAGSPTPGRPMTPRWPLEISVSENQRIDVPVDGVAFVVGGAGLLLRAKK